MPSPPRLTAPEDFRQAYREGTRIANDRIIIHAVSRGAGPARVGVAVRRQLGGAVRRNRVKRRIREASARTYALLPAGVDVVVVPRSTAVHASFGELVAALTDVFMRARAEGRP
jgi:ribonuclease P protein component